MSKLTYKKSGVNVAKANDFVNQIKPIVKKTKRPEVLSGVGGFGALFGFDAKRYSQPVLVSSTDGVGTKLKIAKELKKFEVLGVDLVAMNVNDIVTCGAEPLFFLDYFAVGKLEIPFMKQVVSGIASGCRQAGCALVGGETAEMPGLYRQGDFDLAGFSVGVVEKKKHIDGKRVKAKDVVIGLASNGFHANGFSLVRKALSAPFMKKNANEILKPTKIYTKAILELIKKVQVNAMAHITGGGFYDNIPRVLPNRSGVQIDAGSWKVPTVFEWVQKKGKISFKEMHHTFNMGIGFIVVVRPSDVLKTLNSLSKSGIKSWVIGEVVKKSGVHIQ